MAISKITKNSNYLRAIKYCLILLFIALIGNYFYTNQEKLDLLKTIQWSDFVVLSFITTLIFLTYTYNNLIILEKFGLKKIRFLLFFKISIIARYVNFYITQGKTLYLGYRMKKDFDFSYTNSISVISLQTWYYTLSTLLLCVLTIIISEFGHLRQHTHTIITILLACLIILILPKASAVFFKHVQIGYKPIQWIHRKFQNVIENINRYAPDPALIKWSATLSCAQFILYFLMVHLGFRAIAVPIDLLSSTLFTIVLVFSKFFNVIPGNLGLTEWLCGSLTASIGADLGSGVIVSSLIRIVDYLVVSIFGIAYLGSWKPKKNLIEELKESET